MKSQTTEAARAAFKELDLTNVTTLATTLKAMKGVKEVILTTKAKKLILFITLKKKEDDAVYQQVIEVAAKSNSR